MAIRLRRQDQNHLLDLENWSQITWQVSPLPSVKGGGVICWCILGIVLMNFAKTCLNKTLYTLFLKVCREVKLFLLSVISLLIIPCAVIVGRKKSNMLASEARELPVYFEINVYLCYSWQSISFPVPPLPFNVGGSCTFVLVSSSPATV